MKAKFISLLVLLIMIVGCKPAEQPIAQQEDQQINQQIREMDKPEDSQDNDVSCESPSEYACHPVYSDNANDPPAVCGCTPRCSAGTFLEVSVGESNNPDGTRKASFSCK